MTTDIRLYDSRAARPMELDAQLYLESIGEAIEIIHDALLRAREDCETNNSSSGIITRVLNPLRAHQTLTIMGRRGAGKTSVLLSLLELLEDSTKHKSYTDRLTNSMFQQRWLGIGEMLNDLSCDVIVGGLFEPSLMEKADQLITAVFATLLHRLRTHLLEGPPKNDDRASKAERVMRAAGMVNEHLPALVAHNRLAIAFSRGGAEGMYEEIVRFRSGNNLERALWTFIEEYVGFFNKEMVVLAIDDMDLAQDRMEEVLDSLRRYLTSPRLLVIATGDPRMFNAVLRRHALGSMTPRVPPTHPQGVFTPKTHDEGVLADNLVEQYLKKVLPASMRVVLPDLHEVNHAEYRIFTTKPDSTQHEPHSKPKNVKEHLAELVDICLGGRGTSSFQKSLPPQQVDRLYDRYRLLIPRDARHFIELCALRPVVERAINDSILSPDEISAILYRFARLWRESLDRLGMTPRNVLDLSRDPRVGLKVLNRLIVHDRLDEVALRLDHRTDDEDLNVTLVLLKFAMEGFLDRHRASGVLSLALDFFIPAYYLAPDKDEKMREIIRKQVELQLLDSHHRLYLRFVPWLVSRRSHVQAGVVRLCDQVGRLEKLLDLHDGSPTAEWRWILGDPDRRDFPTAREEAEDAAKAYLRKGVAQRAGVSSQGTIPSPDLPPISGWRWAEHHLPGAILKSRWATAAFSSDVRKSRPWASEVLPSPHLFDHLAGMIPRMALRCWTLRTGKHTYLSPWQALTLLQRILNRLEIRHQKRDWGESHSQHIEAIRSTVSLSLRKHLGDSAGPLPSQVAAQVENESYSLGDINVEDLGWKWKSLTNQVRQAHNPFTFYPDFKKKDEQFLWPDPPPLQASGSAKPPPIYNSKSNDGGGDQISLDDPLSGLAFAWNPPSNDSSAPWRHLHRIRGPNDLEACRNKAWDASIERLAQAITEWAWYWNEVLFPSEHALDQGTNKSFLPLRHPHLDTVRDLITTFFEELDDEERFAGIWSGAGDIIQRWVLSFLNAVLDPPPEQRIVTVQLLDRELDPRYVTDKSARLDVLASDVTRSGASGPGAWRRAYIERRSLQG